MLNSEQILEILPHRHSMLLVDRLVELAPGKRCVATKMVSGDPRLVRGPGGRQFFPHTLIMEAMAQVAGIPMGSPDTDAALMVAMDGFEFEGLVCPGDELRIEGNVQWQRGKLFRSRVEACTDSGFHAVGHVTYACQPGLRIEKGAG